MRRNFQNLPTKVIFCKKCVISNQRPSSIIEFKNKIKSKKEVIGFEKGVCAACTYNEIKQKINWKSREGELIKLLDKHRKNNGDYDVIVPGSGGKDSAFVSHLLKYKYNMNPLTVTWSPHLYTEIGKKNFYNWINDGGLDNILFTPNGKLQRYLTKISFENLLHPFQPFILGQRQIGPKFALKFGVNLIMYGETGAEYGNNTKETKKPSMDIKYFTERNLKNIFLGGKSIKQIMRETKFKLSDFNPYIPINPKQVLKKKIEVHHLSYYKKWDPQENFYYAAHNCGFKPNTERTEGTYSKYSSIDDKIDNFHYYTTYIKFGLGRATYDSCQEIRSGKITRDEAIKLVKLYDHEFPKKYFKDFLNYIDIDEGKFFKIINSFRPSHLWRKINGKYVLINKL